MLTQYPITDAWVTRPERLKGGKDEIKRSPRLLVSYISLRPLPLSFRNAHDFMVPLDFMIFLSTKPMVSPAPCESQQELPHLLGPKRAPPCSPFELNFAFVCYIFPLLVHILVHYSGKKIEHSKF